MRSDDDRKIAEALADPFNPSEVKFKPQMVKNNRCLAMAYIDARLIQDRLDAVVGVENWKDRYTIAPDGSVVCRLAVKFHSGWVTKVDVGSPSEQPDQGDRLKAAFSDALKRAAVKFGVGRYLYRLPAQWVDYDPVKKQIVTPPQLPAFARPRAAGAAGPTVNAGGQHGRVPADKVTTPVTQDGTDKKVLKDWDHLLTAVENTEDINQLLYHFKKPDLIPKHLRQTVWDKVVDRTDELGFVFDASSNTFIVAVDDDQNPEGAQ